MEGIAQKYGKWHSIYMKFNELAKEVIAGKWSAGEERKQKLTAAGYDYGKVQARVNELMKNQ